MIKIFKIQNGRLDLLKINNIKDKILELFIDIDAK